MSERIFFQKLMFLGFKLSNGLQFAPKREKLFSKYLFPEPSLEPTVEKDSLRLRDYSRRGRSGKLHSLSQSDSTKWRFLNDVRKKFNPLITVTFMQLILTIVCFWFAPMWTSYKHFPYPLLSLHPSLSTVHPSFQLLGSARSWGNQTCSVHCAFETPETEGIFNSPAWQQLLNLTWISGTNSLTFLKSS